MAVAGSGLRRVLAAGVLGRYVEAGDGPPVVLLASPLARVRPYRPTVDALARDHRVVAVELPGCGTAAYLPVPWTLEQYAAWVAAALDVLGLAGATVIGHSHGGGVAVVLAAECPGHVGRLVLADAIGTYRQPLARSILGRVADTLAVEYGLAWREWSVLPFAQFAHFRNNWGQISNSLAADLGGYARRVGCPTLVGWGARDNTLPPSAGAEYARLIPGAERSVSPTGSHCWLITHPDEFAAAVGKFVRRTSPR